ncbi:hypothetical protein [Roseomonas indoligenes]|uniref:Uncharacterized protein n=1 Tax=Roseomonas indoligenes TaxID=2820811 RepID=A0A940MZC3_9PROT|nr:hypothetical protein [Pararoseomonas indoligenes]MBP0493644.1 hypothetical protein [Pararoseomonas indoligenes]
MIKASLLIMTVLTVLISMLLSWRERRKALARPAAPLPRGRRAPARLGLMARAKVGLDRWVTAAAIAALLTIAVLGGLHWLRVLHEP